MCTTKHCKADVTVRPIFQNGKTETKFRCSLLIRCALIQTQADSSDSRATFSTLMTITSDRDMTGR